MSKKAETPATPAAPATEEKVEKVTTTTPATPAKTRTKKEKATPASTAPATPTTEVKGFKVDGLKVALPIMSIKTSPCIIDNALAFSYEVVTKWKETTLPKTCIVENIGNYSKLVLGKVLDNTVEKFTSKIASLDKKAEKNELSERELCEKSGYTKALENIKALRKTYGCNKSNLVYDDMAHLFACKFTGDKLPIETSQLRTALTKSYEVLTSVLKRFMAGENVKITPAEQDAINAVKVALKVTFEKFLKETDYNKKFDLSISNNDVLRFYQCSIIGRDSNDNPIFIWNVDKNGKDNMRLHNELVTWIFAKIKATVA